MTIGIGTDILKISRIEQDVSDGKRTFINAVYTGRERAEAEERSKPALFYATRFAGKEAVYKCFGEVSGEIRWNEIEILSGENGKPTVSLSGACRAHAELLGIKSIHLSLSYDGEYAIAFAIAESGESPPIASVRGRGDEE